MKEAAENDAYKYLFAVIRTADWIPDNYREFAEKYRTDSAALKELFLCICDKVPMDVLQVAEMAQPVEEAFRQCRRKHLKRLFEHEYSDEIARIRVSTASTEKEIRKMSDTVQHIAEAIPTFDELFAGSIPDQESEEVGILYGNIQENHKMATVVSVQPTDEMAEHSLKNRNIMKTGRMTKMMVKLQKLFNQKPVDVVLDMLSKGYSHEQINYILSCMDEGMSEEEIKAFADPRIPVDVMQKLKQMKVREREKNGT